MMQPGDFAKYRNTGTVGKVMEVVDRPDGRWVLLDTYNLYYEASYLEPASESDYKVRKLEEASLEEQLEKMEQLKEQLAEAERNISRITPSGT
ncbi:MAG: DUF2098 domain-containing protein [Methanomassiliicoccales archaeon]|jgi:hypothetical protein|nr:DUF2098 domain-containing protein [Methanomassiliicoccales archaeon]